MHQLTRSRRVGSILLGTWLGLGLAASPVHAQSLPDSAPAAASGGHVVDGPANLRNFAPKDDGLPAGVDAHQLNLRKVFEDLGPDATLWYQHVETLSNPFFEGRAPGSRGGELAAQYIEYYLRMYGLEPAFPSQPKEAAGQPERAFSSFRQNFDFASPSPDVKVLSASASVGGVPFEQGKQFVVLGNSGNGQVSAPLAFVGYGIAEGKDGYTSFEKDTDLKGRIAVLLRYEPLNEEGKSQWSEFRFSRWSGISGKLAAVAERGAAGIILVNPPGAVEGKSGLETVKDSARFGKRLGVPVVQMSPDAVEELLKQADPEHRDLTSLRKLADAGQIKTIDLSKSLKVDLSADLEAKDKLDTFNVAGVLRGKGNLADQWIVIGGHFDHVGYGYTGAMPQNVGKLHPGADDNASGTAGVLMAARRLSQDYDKAGEGANLRSILFVAFSAEEAGLLGSKYLVEHPPVPLESIDLMINMDMIGRLRSDNLLVQGIGTAEGMESLLQTHFESSGMTISKTGGGSGPSDHSSFYEKDVPVLFLFTGEHAEYHQPTDRGYTVNPAGAIRVIDLVQAVTLDMAARPEKLKFVKTADSGGGGRGPGGAKVSLGTRPDYNAQLETGMRVDTVSENGAAAEAGIQAGDVLLSWNGEEITGPRKISEFLMKHEPGDKVKIKLQRGDQDLTVEVRLKARQAQ